MILAIDWNSIAAQAGALIGALFIFCATVRKRLSAGLSDLRTMREQVLPNGGKSLADAVFRIEASVTGWRRVHIEMEGGAVFETDAEGHCIWVSSAYSEITGMSCRDCKDFGWLTAIDTRDREMVSLEWTAAISESRTFQMRHRMRHVPTDSSFKVTSRAVGVYAGPEIVGFFGTVEKET